MEMFPEIGELDTKKKRIKPIPILRACGQAETAFGKVDGIWFPACLNCKLAPHPRQDVVLIRPVIVHTYSSMTCLASLSEYLPGES